MKSHNIYQHYIPQCYLRQMIRISVFYMLIRKEIVSLLRLQFQKFVE